MFDAMLPWSAHMAGAAYAGGEPPRSASQRSLGGAAFYNIYATSDGQHIVLGGREMKFARNLLRAFGREDLIPVAGAEAGEAQAPLVEFLRTTFASQTRAEWEAWFADKDVAFAPVLDFREAFAGPVLAERGLLTSENGVHQLAPAIRFASDGEWRPRPAPELGADG
jgi:crotonobetainyl-CoA:carnitine CoA-transferase CaiB-like acyl-CoA transferase